MRNLKKYGMCRVSIAPIRKYDSDTSEMISQLLFGEKVEVIIKRHNNWAKVRCLHDDYVGWLDKRQLYYMDDKEFAKYDKQISLVAEFAQGSNSGDEIHCLSFGAELPKFDGMSFKTPFGKFIYNGQFVSPNEITDKREKALHFASKFLLTPYLWGGRSPFGIDCSGFTQIIFKLIGEALPRDSKDQVFLGENIDFVNQAQAGDLAFFEKDNKVHHVGIIMDDQQIIHASGYVRIDKLDHFGIYNKEEKRYTHTLKICKRILA